MVLPSFLLKENRRKEKNTMDLKSNYYKEGLTKDTFRRELHEIDGATKMIELTPVNTKFMTLSGNSVYQDAISFMMLDNETIDAIEHHKATKRILVKRNVISNWQLQELGDVNFMILNDGKAYFVDAAAVRWLLHQLGIQGGTTPSFARDLYITEVFNNRKGAPIRALYREKRYCTDHAKNEYVVIRKIINFVSPQYVYQPLCVLSKILAEVTKKKGAQLVGWKTTIRDAQFRVEFPALGEEYATAYKLSKVFIPGIVVRLSDGGDTGYSACQTLRVSGSSEYTIVNKDLDGVFASHRNMDITSLAAKTSALTDTLRETLTLLDGKGVPFQESITDVKKQMPIILNAYLRLCQARRIISDRMKQEAINAMMCRVNGGEVNTVADIIGLILSIPDILSRKINTDDQMNKLRVVCGRAVVLSWDEVIRSVENTLANR